MHKNPNTARILLAASKCSPIPHSEVKTLYTFMLD